jgi:hypothetical protein
MQGNRPAGVLLVLAALFLMAFAAAAAGAAAYSASGRVVTSQAAAETRASAHLDTTALTRRMEDEVAPELSWAASLLGAGGGNSITYTTANRNRPVCIKSCAAKRRHQPYTRPCARVYLDRGC